MLDLNNICTKKKLTCKHTAFLMSISNPAPNLSGSKKVLQESTKWDKIKTMIDWQIICFFSVRVIIETILVQLSQTVNKAFCLKVYKLFRNR